jgi:uncharacterized protein (TIGR00661 family)
MMKIFYAVQATGNGHISRANAILPILQQYGDVDIFLSGNNSALKTSLPVAYRSRGISLRYDVKSGGIDVMKTIGGIRLRKLLNEARFLPVEKYDLVINDFECITSLACKFKGISSVHFGHQASFMSKKVPRPGMRNPLGEWVLSNYATGTRSIGLHFKQYDDNIFSPVIKPSILHATPVNEGHITVYLGHYADHLVVKQLQRLKNFKFHLFSKQVDAVVQEDNIKLLPLSQAMFDDSLIRSHGVITGAGFETPAEALYLGKQLMVLPMHGQYEQACNAAALKEFNVAVVDAIDDYFPAYFNKWIFDGGQSLPFSLSTPVEKIVESVVHGKVSSLVETPMDLIASA